MGATTASPRAQRTATLPSMKKALQIVTFSLAAALALGTGCDEKKDEAKAEKKDEAKAEKKDEGPSLRLSNDTEACQNALKCCVESVKLRNDGKADPEQVNLSCSGVGMAPDDATCKQFADGYKPLFEAEGKPVPEVCG